jgi:hypothetical protein
MATQMATPASSSGADADHSPTGATISP